MKSIRARDILERLLWTSLAAVLSNLAGVAVLDMDAWKGAVLAGFNALVTYVLVVARWRLSVLPEPGAAVAEGGYKEAISDVKELAPAPKPKPVKKAATKKARVK